MAKAFYDMDEFCMVQLLPAEALNFCLKEMSLTDVYKEEDDSGNNKISRLNIKSKDIVKALYFLPSYDGVETGNEELRIDDKDTLARGEGEGHNVFWSVDDKGIVTAIWLDMVVHDHCIPYWKKVLSALSELAGFILADWDIEMCVDISNHDAVEEYLFEKAQEE